MADITRQIETEIIYIFDEEQCMFFIIFYVFYAMSSDVNLRCLYNMHEGCTIDMQDTGGQIYAESQYPDGKRILRNSCVSLSASEEIYQ